MPHPQPEDNENARLSRESNHFTKLYGETGHTWWGNLTKAGQQRNERRMELFARLTNISPQSKLLEVGCGAGEYTRRLAAFGCSIVAIDITPLLVQTARKKVPDPKVSFLVMDATYPAFPEQQFDIIFGKSVLHHLDFRNAMQSYRRLLKPGGRLFFSEPNFLNPLVFFGIKIPWLRRKMEFSDDEIAFTRGQLENIVKEAGFEDVRVINYDFMFPLIPDPMVEAADRWGQAMEKVPGIRSFSGSLLLTATRA